MKVVNFIRVFIYVVEKCFDTLPIFRRVTDQPRGLVVRASDY